MSIGSLNRRGPALRSVYLHRLIATATLVLFLTVTGTNRDTLAFAQEANEYQVKAAFLFNFAKFIEWPAELFANAEAPIVIGVVGDTPGGNAIGQAINGKTANGRRLSIKRFATVKAITFCHLLFVSSSQADALQQILSAAGPAVLTVGETERFSELGGKITFVVVDSKLRFDINQTAAKQGGLRISAKLLGLARQVR